MTPTTVSAQKTAQETGPKKNRIGLTMQDYKGAASTLCAGCGHDAITSSIVKAFFEMDVPPHQVAKLSGIGCSSKTTNYFFNTSHGFNSVHGRMATIATGTAIANRNLINIGISGDGDTASIGLGNFCHMIRREIPMVYILENNGCYGLTKGQFSATADKGSHKKGGDVNPNMPIDCCALAIEMGCGFVARSFSGDPKQVRTLLKAAIAHGGTALVDILSPCVTFNNHEGSTKSYSYAKAHEDPLHDIDFIPSYEQIEVDYEAGAMQVVTLHDGSAITLRKLELDYDATNRSSARKLLEAARYEGLFYTGLLYYNEKSSTIQDNLNLVNEPLATLPESMICPDQKVFDEIMDSFR
ncbi:MAG: 2-oxoglutarate ferredoxin oxidoreductase subunit beta [Phycisphaerae bacterium]|nr:MAG: 2-oxoglutarate ferredoxin oxidoreductase subunit beta [Phycisphaerae bacterium]